MQQRVNPRIVWLTVGLGVGLLFMGALRYSAAHPGFLTLLAGLATPGYVAVAVVFTILLMRAGVPFNRLGFSTGPGIRQILLALVAVVLLRLLDLSLSPLLEELLGARNLERFSDVKDSPGSLAALLAMSWTFAAFGEELTYRIVLMRSISYVLSDSRNGHILALVLQAVLFGLIHAYQGPAGIVGSTVSGLVFGAVTLAGKRSIWPAALAHGANNTFGILELYSV